MLPCLEIISEPDDDAGPDAAAEAEPAASSPAPPDPAPQHGRQAKPGKNRASGPERDISSSAPLSGPAGAAWSSHEEGGGGGGSLFGVGGACGAKHHADVDQAASSMRSSGGDAVHQALVALRMCIWHFKQARRTCKLSAACKHSPIGCNRLADMVPVIASL